MSPMPKIDEIAVTVETIKPDIAVFTKRTLPDEIVNIPTLQTGSCESITREMPVVHVVTLIIWGNTHSSGDFKYLGKYPQATV